MKKKTNRGEKKLGQQSNSSNYGSWWVGCLFLGIMLVTFSAIALKKRWDREGGVSVIGNSLTEPHISGKIAQYEDILRRAQALTLRYKNLTGTDYFGSPVKAAILSTSTTLPPIITATNPPTVITKGEAGGGGTSMIQVDNDLIKKKDIVIGMAQDTDPKNLAVFCTSLRKVSSADIILFVNAPIPSRHKQIAETNNVKLIPFDLSSLSEDMQAFHPSTLRWPLIYKFFQDDDVRNSYGRVWMIDVRDAYFQLNPFDMLPAGQKAFYVFGGVESITIKECGWNGGWVKDCFGEKILNEIGSKGIICSGVSMGSMDVVFDYLQLMDDIIMARGKTSIGKSAKFPECERNGVDQGTHNVLVHKNLISNMKFWSQSNGPVANLQAKRARVSGDEVFNNENHKVAVVHQYDRNPQLQKLLFQKVAQIDVYSFTFSQFFYLTLFLQISSTFIG